MNITLTVKNGKAQVTLGDGKVVNLKREGTKTETGLNRHSHVSTHGVFHAYERGDGKATLKPDGETSGGNPKFAFKSANLKAFVVLPQAGKKLATAF